MLSRAADAYGHIVYDHARVLSITGVSARLGRFDTIVTFGNDCGLFGGPRRARWLLRRFDYLLVSPAEMRAIVAGTGWRLLRVLRGRGPLYVGVIEKA